MRAYEDFYTRLDSRDGEKNIYKIANMRKKKIRDFTLFKCIKSDDSRILVKNEEIMER